MANNSKQMFRRNRDQFVKGLLENRISQTRLFFLLIFVTLGLSGCAGRKLPPFERPLPRSQFQKVRTTAYTHLEKDHRKWGRKNAMGTTLQSGAINSAAADWSRWPAGTRFRVLATGREYIVDDYGWALAGTNTIDLYKPSMRDMRTWGVRQVTIEILEWGDVWKSHRIMNPRSKHRHVRRMVRQIEQRYRR